MKAVTIISKVVAFALVLAWQPVSAAVAVPLSGSGTGSDPYKIMSAGDWNALAAYMDDSGDTMGGQSIELGADLDFSHTAFSPVGEFDGIFDGAGHRISGIEYNVTAPRQGVFGRLMQDGSIRNLTLQGKVVSAHNYTAAFAGVVSGTIENCVNEIDVTASASYTAGFAGQADAGARFVNCVNKGEISSSGSYVAGIVADGGAGVTYSRCVNDGVVDNTGLGSYTAGIVAVSLPSSFDRCVNSGEIVIANTAKAQCVAGILAWANNVKGASDDTFEFSGCENDAYINAAGIVAGIVGDVTLEVSGTITNGVVLNMEDCINRGTIVASGSPSGNIGTGGISAFYTPGSKFVGCANYGIVQAEAKPYCGGIVGHFKKIVVMDPVRTLFDGCHNSGTVKAVVGQGSGVLAYCHKNVTIRGCSNSGTVTGKSTMGGLVSTMASGSEIIDCWNSGDVVTDAETAGGIVANNANACVIKGCVNSGDIASKGTTATSGKTVGGIAGTTGSMVSDCINFGTISGFKDVGGLVGAPVKGRTGLVNCYNAGDVIAPEESGGALCGTLASGSWDDTNNVAGCCFVDCFKGAVSEIGRAVSMSELVAMDMGDGWCRISDDCMPLPEVYSDNPMAIVNCAAAVPADGEAFDSIGADMALGLPDGVSWSSSLPAVVISGSRAEVVKAGSEQDVVLTATDGIYSRRWPVRVKAMSGIDSIAGDGVAVASARYYDLGGAEIVRPEAGRIYIVKITYRDGTVSSSKIMYCE